jgi:hypothetical protein
MKTYRVPRWYIFSRYFFLTLLTIIILPVGLIVATAGPEVDLGARLFLIAALLITPFGWYMKLREFHTIVLQDNGLITFHSPIRKATFVLRDIESIRLHFLRQDIIINVSSAGYLINYNAPEIVSMTRIGGLDDFLHTVKSMNPNIEVSI